MWDPTENLAFEKVCLVLGKNLGIRTDAVLPHSKDYGMWEVVPNSAFEISS